jgi:hypothetical protein
LIDWLQQELGSIQGLVQAAAAVLAIIYVLMTWWRTKALVPTLVAMVLAGGVLWAIHNISWFQDKIGQETGMARPPLGLSLVVGRRRMEWRGGHDRRA